MIVILVIPVLLLLIAARILWILPRFPGAPQSQINESGRRQTVRTMIVLGSGGHTTEMLQMMTNLGHDRYSPRHYVIAATDLMSQSKAKTYEQLKSGQRGHHQIHVIPRSREVKQSWITTVGTTAYALIYSFALVFRVQPDLVLCNGPGTCVPICIAAYALRVLGLKQVSLIYIESFARVNHLSLSGRLLYRFADIFLVQWPQLLEGHPHAKYLGVLV